MTCHLICVIIGKYQPQPPAQKKPEAPSKSAFETNVDDIDIDSDDDNEEEVDDDVSEISSKKNKKSAKIVGKRHSCNSSE